MSYFYKLYAPILENRLHHVDDLKVMFSIPWFHHQRIIDKCKDDLDKALFFVKKTWENNWGRDALLNWLSTEDKDNVVAKYALDAYKQPMGISEYQLSQLYPKDFKSSLPTIEELEKRLNDK